MSPGLQMFYVVAIAVAVAVIVLIWLALRRFGKPRQVAVPSCPRCFYNVTGLVSGVCPECGADLAALGILYPGDIKPIGRVAWALIWTVLLLPVALISSPLILKQIPPPWRSTLKQQFTSPASGLYQSVTINGTHDFRPPASDEITARTVTLMKQDASTSVMHIDLDRMHCSFVDTSGKQTRRSLSKEQKNQIVFDWYAAAGLPIDQVTLQFEAQIIADAIISGSSQAGNLPFVFRNNAVTGPMNLKTRPIGSVGNFQSTRMDSTAPFRSISESRSSGPFDDPLPRRVLIAGWIGLWLLGSVLILLRVGRKARLANAAPTIAQLGHSAPSSPLAATSIGETTTQAEPIDA
jgi:hypothetical protein